MRNVPQKMIFAASLAMALIVVPVAPTFAQSNPVGDLLGSVGQLVGDTKIDAEAQAVIYVNNGKNGTDGTTVIAKGATNQTASGVSGLLSSVTGGSTAAGSYVSYGEYTALSEVNADWGLASSTRAIGGLLGSLFKKE